MKHKERIMNPVFRITVLLTCIILCLLFCKPILAQKIIPNPSFNVTRTGTGRPMILIPGLFCSGKVWDETVAHFKDRYECFEITLPGFAGQPPIQSDSILKTIVAQLADFIKLNNLKNPVIVGHSLGGFVALQLASSYPNLVGGLVIVSSAPFLPALSMSADISVDSTRKIGLQIKNGMKYLTAEQIGQYQKFTLPAMIHDSAKISQVAAMAVKSDPLTQGEVMYELFSIDLRPEMKNVICPILVLGDWISYKKYGATHESVLKNYTDQFRLAKKLTISINDSSNHFIMYDEPKWVYYQMETFLD
ncbi:MAG TPA: alpha/beta hydrolase [Puia sp.]|nr:alpha/beta hydrolase [Puia sp.]